MRFSKHLYLLTLLAALAGTASARNIRVLFIGNSYIQTNNLPGIVQALVQHTGDTLTYAANTPGGSRFQQHCTDITTLSLLQQGNWDFVVLQEQSQLPSFSDNQVATDVFPYARRLDSLVQVYNPCAKTIFYMTWGRKNGDAQNCANWPPVCTYRGMDSLLQLRYGLMAAQNRAGLAPVAAVWAKVRSQSPTIELYDADESHPSVAGSFAAASTFYTVITGKDPVLNSYSHTLIPSTAALLRSIARTVVYDSLAYWQRFDAPPTAAFTATANQLTITFSNQSQASRYKWNFGDGQTATLAAPTHSYAANGSYNVCLTAYSRCDSQTLCKQIRTSNVHVANIENHVLFRTFPNPVQDRIMVDGIKTRTAYKLYTITGVLCQQGILSERHAHIDVQQLRNGMYILYLTGSHGLAEPKKVEISH